MNYRDIIAIEPGKRGSRPCIRGMRISVADVLGWLAAGNYLMCFQNRELGSVARLEIY